MLPKTVQSGLFKNDARTSISSRNARKRAVASATIIHRISKTKHGHGQTLLRAWRGVRLWGVLVSFFSLKVKFLAC